MKVWLASTNSKADSQVQVILEFPLRPSVLERIFLLTENGGMNSRHTPSSKGKLTEIASYLS